MVRVSRDAKMARTGAIVLVVVVAGVVGMRHGKTATSAAFDDGDDGSYLGEWAVQIPGGHDIAQRVANELGYIYRGQVSTGVKLSSEVQDDYRPISKTSIRTASSSFYDSHHCRASSWKTLSWICPFLSLLEINTDRRIF